MKPLIWSKNKDYSGGFLQEVTGVVHVGANTGQERKIYTLFRLNVLWVEPIPSIFDRLVENIKRFPNQKAVQGLLTDRDDEVRPFYIANNGGASSSILAFKEHQNIWPQVNFNEVLTLKTLRLETLFVREQLNPLDYQALVLDTQGSELLVLKGSIALLGGFKFIKTEVPDFEAYEGCCRLEEMESFMLEHGFSEYSRNKFAGGENGESYFDIVYRNTSYRER